MMKTLTITLFPVLILLLMGCNDPLPLEEDPSKPHLLIRNFASSTTYNQLEARFAGLQISEASVVEFNQRYLLVLPVYSSEAGSGKEGIIVRANTNNTFTGLLRIRVTGSTVPVDSDFTGDIIVQELLEDGLCVANFLKGRLHSKNSGGFHTVRSASDCGEVCELVSCVGEKFSEANFVERLVCGLDLVQCITVYVSECLFLDEIIPALI